MAETPMSVNELAREINLALARVGKPDWRREFNTKLWSCSRDRALEVIAEYRYRLMGLMVAQGWDESSTRLVSAARS